MLPTRMRTFLSRVRVFKHDPLFRRPRYWTNLQLRRIAPHFTGDVVNVSGWADEDKFGSTYREYFINARSYVVSNWRGGPQRGIRRFLPDSIPLDLDFPLREELHLAFDCALVHTVLEHVWNIFQAVENLCNLCRDSVIVIVPFVQAFHGFQAGPSPTDGFSDYWRFTPFAVEKLFCDWGLKAVYRQGVDIPGTSLYYLFVFSRFPETYFRIFGPPNELGSLPLGADIYTRNRLRRTVKYLLFGRSE
jgi:hypothetical protein